MVDVTGPFDREKRFVPGAEFPNEVTVEPTILEEAQSIIYGDRMAEYGNALTNFTEIAQLWSVVLGTKVYPEQVALCMIQLKVARATNDLRVRGIVGRDTKVDIAGYAGCIEKIEKGV